MPEPVPEQASTPSIANNRSQWKDFIASIPAIRGDPSNFSAPPFVLDTKSAVELPAYWAERPAVFVAPSKSDDPAERAVLVLKWFIASLRNQQYAGRPADQGVKKPLNAFLGEVFLASWKDDAATGNSIGITRLVSEQVSHHPPVTACRIWNEDQGVSAEGYTRQEITFTNTMNINQMGHATFHLARHNETYLIPLPNVKIKGILTGSLYPELHGTYRIPSTSGHSSSIEFGGTGFMAAWDKKHSFKAKVYRDDEAETKPLYTVNGYWDGVFTIHDTRKGVDIETFDVRTAKTTPLTVDSLADQDPWESRFAWRAVREALERGDMQGTADAKSKLESGQREFRKSDDGGRNWRSLFYEVRDNNDPVAEQLARQIGRTLYPAETLGAWKFRLNEWRDGKFKKPYHGHLKPDNTHVSESGSDKQAPNTARVIDKIAQGNGTQPANGISSLAGTASRTNSNMSGLGKKTSSEQEQDRKDVLNGASKISDGSSPNGAGAMTVTEKMHIEMYMANEDLRV
ncbi:hypothetical protein A1O1_07713 [Capronia coronata CBS 617.96]|uniref:Oxysterol-binding protein n=1 Tax=Capronia coronata CBS 617.96 TaxID=1182541 RepID=W9XN46_9EURO|nr:uncharacterized protein A1O1_07713 [Capronia coronata CBS 617.96]EXJ81648.1 hypothetical protein A1O1_07713 [Capronia coronata CBS 617.96]